MVSCVKSLWGWTFLSGNCFMHMSIPQSVHTLVLCSSTNVWYFASLAPLQRYFCVMPSCVQIAVPDGRLPVIKKCLFPLFSPKNNIKHSSSVRVLPVVSSPMVHGLHGCFTLSNSSPNSACITNTHQHYITIIFLSGFYLGILKIWRILVKSPNSELITWTIRIHGAGEKCKEVKMIWLSLKSVCVNLIYGSGCVSSSDSDQSPLASATGLTASLELWAEDKWEHSYFA